MSEAVMDFPAAWAFVADTKLEDHHPKCSYRTEARALLCDCDVLNDEYKRREKLRAPKRRKGK
jgi:hypothetical protein